MLRVVVEIESPASVDFVRNWWLDYGEGDANLTGDILARTALWVDKTHADLRTTSRFAGRTIENVGVVRVEGPDRWQYEGTISLHDEPFASIRTEFGLADLGAARRLTARFSFRGRTIGAKLLLPFLGRLVRHTLVREYDEFRAAIEAEWHKAHG